MASPYDKIIEMIKKLDLRDDGIVMNHKIKSIEKDFCNIVRDESMLSESMDYINDEVLSDGDASLKFALLFSSRNFDSLAMNETKVRSKMLRILQNNFIKAEEFRKDDKNRLFNLITLHGEYYHRVRLADNNPISILGESLLGLLTQEISGENPIDIKLAKLILSQITLNGSMMRNLHKEELNLLLFHVRRNMIEQPNMTPAVKAVLLMTLDLYYSNFSNLGQMLEDMYTKYLVEDEEENKQNEPSNNLENENNDSFDSSESQSEKPWSQQVMEEAMYLENQSNFVEKEESNLKQPNEYNQQQQHDQSHNEQTSNEENEMHGDNNFNEIPPPSQWRNKRFPRNIHDQNNDRQDFSNKSNNNNQNNRRNRRFSGNFDDDRQSVRSEGGNSRFYSVNDRLASNSKNDRSNWERGMGPNQSYDRYNQRNGSRKSMNFENYNGNNGGNNRGHYNNRNSFDRPPRFRNNDKFKNSGESIRINDPSWRNGPNGDGNYSRSGSRGPESDSRSSSRNRNLPNLSRNINEDYKGQNQSPDERNDYHANYVNRKDGSDGGFNNYRHNGRRPQTSRNFGRNNQHRYSSQNSLTSESSTWDRRNNRRNNRAQSQEWDETRSLHGQSDENTWNSKENNSELVKNAQNTTKYMQYLSEK